MCFVYTFLFRDSIWWCLIYFKPNLLLSSAVFQVGVFSRLFFIYFWKENDQIRRKGDKNKNTKQLHQRILAGLLGVHHIKQPLKLMVESTLHAHESEYGKKTTELQ